MSTRHWAITATMCLTGCNNVTAAGDFEAPRLLNHEFWAGSTVEVRAGWLGSTTDPLTLSLDSLDLVLTRVDDSTVSATLPGAFSGHFSASLSGTGQFWDLGPLTVFGYAETGVYDVDLPWDLLTWPTWGHATLFAGDWNGGLTRIDFDLGAEVTHDSLHAWWKLRGPGVTYRPGIFLLSPANSDTVESWRLLPFPQRVGTHPGISAHRQLMQLGPDVWFVSSHHQWRVCSRADSTLTYDCTSTPAEETEGVHMSPRGDRATIQIDRAWSGVPVFEVPTGQLAYTIPHLTSALAIGFSPEGDVLAAAGDETDENRLLLLDATTGAILRDTTLEHGVFAVKFDAIRPLLYVASYEVNSTDTTTVEYRPKVLVFDRSTFRVVGEMVVAPMPANTPQFDCYKSAILQSAEPALYVACTFAPPVRYWRFSLPVDDGL